jgi:hypothetical protein
MRFSWLVDTVSDHDFLRSDLRSTDVWLGCVKQLRRVGAGHQADMLITWLHDRALFSAVWSSLIWVS